MVSSNPNLSKSFLKSNVVLLLGTVVFALLFLEVAIRFTSPQATYRNFTQIDAPVFQNSETLPWTLKPHSEGRQVSPYGEFDIFIEINAHGLRGPETETSKGLQRILFLGDSFTFGHGVEEKKTYPRLVETLLNGRLKNKKYEILNAGYADAYSPDSYFVYLKGNLKKLDPRAVVLGFYLRNDIVDLSSTIWKRTNAEGLPDKIVSPKYWIDPYGRRRRPKAGILKMDFVYQIHIFLNMYYINNKWVSG